MSNGDNADIQTTPSKRLDVEAKIENSFSTSESESESEELEESHTSLLSYKLPIHTFSWTLSDINYLHVFYHTDFKPVSAIIDMVCEHTGMFGPLTMDQKEVVKKLHDCVTFSSSMDEVFFMGSPMADLCFRKMIQNVQLHKKQPFSITEDFVRNTLVMIKQAVVKERIVTKDVFIDLFKSFVKMCDLIPINGTEWIPKRKILQQQVTSVSDIVIQTDDYLNDTGSEATVAVVSITGAKNMTPDVNVEKHVHSTNYTPIEKEIDCENQNHGQPTIFSRIDQNILAQHAGELLLHVNSYSCQYVDEKRKCYWLPGMIVVGTQVSLTLLKYNLDHLKELENNSYVENGRSVIYYSELKDLLKKEDRDLLIETFARLSNSTENS